MRVIATSLNFVSDNIATWWSRLTQRAPAALRVFAFSLAGFIAIAATYSPQESAANAAAESLDVADPMLESFRRGVADHDAFRVLVLGSSEATVPGWLEGLDHCRTIAVCLERSLETQLDIPVDARFKFVPAIPGRRFEMLKQFALQDLDIDLLVVSYAVHTLAKELATDSMAVGTSSARSRSRSGLAHTIFGHPPLQLLDIGLRSQFYAYESRFKYSLAQRVPFGKKPVIVRFGAQPAMGHIAEQDGTGPLADVRPETVADPDFANRIAEIAGQAIEDQQDLQASFRVLRNRAASVAPKLLVVFTPVGKHFFTSSEREKLEAYLSAIENAASESLTIEDTAYVNTFDLYAAATEKFDDPVHLISFELLGDTIAEKIVERKWAAREDL